MIRTIRPVAFGDDAYAEYDYDDTTGEIVAVRGVNDSAQDFWVRVQGTAGSGSAATVDYYRTFAAGSGTTQWDVPQGQRKRFTLEPDGGDPGRPDYYPTLAGLTIAAGTG